MVRPEWFMAAEGPILCVTCCEPGTVHKVQLGEAGPYTVILWIAVIFLQ